MDWKLAPQTRMIEPNVTTGVAYVRIGLDSPVYVVQNGLGEPMPPDLNSLSIKQLRDILEHRTHQSRTKFRTNVNCSYTWEDEDNNRTLTFDVYGNVSKYVPAQTYGPPENCYPAEGGELEDYYAELVEAEVYDDEGNTIQTLEQMTWKQVMQLELAFEEEIEKQGSIFESLQETLFEIASEPPDYD